MIRVDSSVISAILATEKEDGTYVVPKELKDNFLWYRDGAKYVCFYCDEYMFGDEFKSYKDMMNWSMITDCE